MQQNKVQIITSNFAKRYLGPAQCIPLPRNENFTIYMCHLAPFVVVIEGLDDNNRTVCITSGAPYRIVTTPRNGKVRDVSSLRMTTTL